MWNALLKILNKSYYHDIIECLIVALEAKDRYTSGHSSRVADLSYVIAKAMGIRGTDLEDIHIAAHLHDIGKVGIHEGILNKTGKLLPHEWEQIKRHPEIGYSILIKSRSLKKIAQLVLYHHERWDGKGYPKGLKANLIPIGSRIINVADAIDAMTTSRSYRAAMDPIWCRKELENCKGIQFDPLMVETTLKIWDRIEKIIDDDFDKKEPLTRERSLA